MTPTKLHLGCGKQYLQGWINIDLNSKIADVHADLLRPFQYADKSVDFIFHEHLIEHFTDVEGMYFLEECKRVLKDTGVMRMSTPNLEWIVNRYRAKCLDEWRNMHFVPDSPCQLLNQSMRKWQHKFLYDMDELSSCLGRRQLAWYTVRWRESEYPELEGLETRPYHKELIVEAVRG